MKQLSTRFLIIWFLITPLLLIQIGCGQAKSIDNVSDQPSLNQKKQQQSQYYPQYDPNQGSGSASNSGSSASGSSSGQQTAAESAQCTKFKTNVSQVKAICGPEISTGASMELVSQTCMSAFSSVPAPECTNPFVAKVQAALDACNSVFVQYQSQIPECVAAINTLRGN